MDRPVHKVAGAVRRPDASRRHQRSGNLLQRPRRQPLGNPLLRGAPGAARAIPPWPVRYKSLRPQTRMAARRIGGGSRALVSSFADAHAPTTKTALTAVGE